MLGWPRLTVDDLPSTMDLAHALAARGAREGTTVIARHQSTGRGRAGRTWETPPGTALLCSVILRPALPLAELTPMALLAGDAIATAIRRVSGLNARVKWPNDVLIGERKIAGILIQTRQAPPGVLTIVGFGINTAVPTEALTTGATSLLAEGVNTPPYDVALDAVMRELEARYRDVLAGRAGEHLERIGQGLAMLGEDVTIRDADRDVRGVILGVDRDGALLIDVAGERRRIIAGDVVRGPRRIAAGPG